MLFNYVVQLAVIFSGEQGRLGEVVHFVLDGLHGVGSEILLPHLAVAQEPQQRLALGSAVTVFEVGKSLGMTSVGKEQLVTNRPFACGFGCEDGDALGAVVIDTQRVVVSHITAIGVVIAH